MDEIALVALHYVLVGLLICPGAQNHPFEDLGAGGQESFASGSIEGDVGFGIVSDAADYRGRALVVEVGKIAVAAAFGLHERLDSSDLVDHQGADIGLVTVIYEDHADYGHHDEGHYQRNIENRVYPGPVVVLVEGAPFLLGCRNQTGDEISQQKEYESGDQKLREIFARTGDDDHILV